MLAEIDLSVYDVHGKPVAAVRKRHRLATAGVPFGRFFSHPLAETCKSIEEIRTFLRTCRYESDLQQFGKKDHWLPPEEFEVSRRGDCEDFVLWTWRQLVQLGFECRFVAGRAGFYGSGHAWLTVNVSGRDYLLEPQARRAATFPRLSVVRYSPTFSVEWDGTRMHFYEHEPTKPYPTLGAYARLVPEWLLFQSQRGVRVLMMVCMIPWLLTKRLLRRRAA